MLASDDADDLYASLSRLAFHPGVPMAAQSLDSELWTPALDKALTVAVRANLFDFDATAKELSVGR